MISRYLAKLEFLLLPLLRLVTGVIFTYHGQIKIFDRGLEGVTRFLESIGFFLPRFWAIVLMTFEFCGGILVILGLLTRYVAAGWIVIMLVAIFAVKLPQGFSAMQIDLLLLACSLALLFGGSGRWSLEEKLFGKQI